MKFGRKYTLSVEVAPDTNRQPTKNVVIELPYSCEFVIERTNLASSQTATFTIYNLGKERRNLLQKDQSNVGELRAIQFRGGYDDIGTPLCFNGTVMSAYSERRGVNFVTVIQAYDGGYAMANGTSNFTIGSGATFKEIMQHLLNDLPGIARQAIIGNFPTKTARGSSYVGNTWNYLMQVSGGLANIDNGQLKVLQPNEVITAEIPVINSASGLLTSPKRAGSLIEFSMLFEPRLTVGQIVQLESTGVDILNGPYKVTGFTHRGMISPSVGGDAVTDVTLWKGTAVFVPVPGEPVQ